MIPIGEIILMLQNLRISKSIPGWGYRYKVRIFGLHDAGEGGIESKDLPWANIMYPVTAGAYLQALVKLL